MQKVHIILVVLFNVSQYQYLCYKIKTTLVLVYKKVKDMKLSYLYAIFVTFSLIKYLFYYKQYTRNSK